MSKNKNKEKSSIQDNIALLNLMVKDAKKLEGIYQPGPYWAKKTKSAVNEIKNFGLTHFRGFKNGAAHSYSDVVITDVRHVTNYGIRGFLSKVYRNLYPLNRLFDGQVNITTAYFKEELKYKTIYLKNHDRVNYLLAKYSLNFETTKGGCESFADFEGVNVSFYYLNLLDTLDYINQKTSIANKKTFFEIGGGFGANTHLVIELFNIKKIIYLDIAPNLYVGTQYLKSFYGEKVIDYSLTKDMKNIEFSDNDELEVFCIQPNQIEKIKSKIDWFHNENSFVEMPKKIIKNYAHKIEDILSNDNPTISLVSYDGFGLHTKNKEDYSNTSDPEILPTFFTKPATKNVYPTLTSRSCVHFIIE